MEVRDKGSGSCGTPQNERGHKNQNTQNIYVTCGTPYFLKGCHKGFNIAKAFVAPLGEGCHNGHHGVKGTPTGVAETEAPGHPDRDRGN